MTIFSRTLFLQCLRRHIFLLRLDKYTSPEPGLTPFTYVTPLMYNSASVCEGAAHNGPNMLGLNAQARRKWRRATCGGRCLDATSSSARERASRREQVYIGGGGHSPSLCFY